MSFSNNDLRRISRPISILTVVLCCADFAVAAGLVGYRNDTNQAVTVQSTVVVNGAVRRSKPQTIYPGEVALDGLAYAGRRTIAVYDAKKTNVVLFQGDVSSTDDVFFSIRPVAATVPIKGQLPPPPKVELVKTRPPANSKMPQPPKK